MKEGFHVALDLVRSKECAQLIGGGEGALLAAALHRLA
jgi:hypothetical protein